MQQAVTARRLFDGRRFYRRMALVWEKRHIVDIVPVAALSEQVSLTDFGNSLIVPGFIDIQVNGGGGVMLNQSPTVDGISRIIATHRQFGTAYCLPTLISGRVECIRASLEAVQEAMENNCPGLLGIHLEGPWLSAVRRGAHDEQHFFDPSVEFLQTLPWPEQGAILITLAPERVNRAALEWLHQKDILLSCGHSNALWIEMETVKHLISGFTHLYNAMSPQQNREPGVVGSALSLDHAWCSVIADGIHVHPANILMAMRNKPPGKLLVVSDAMASVGQFFELNGEKLQVRSGRLVNREGNLAGAHITMDQSLQNLLTWGVDEAEAIRMVSTYPAMALNLENQLGYLQTGCRAQATILDGQYQCQACLVDGQLDDFRKPRNED